MEIQVMILFRPHPRILGGFTGRNLDPMKKFGLELKDLVILKQVHGDRAHEIRSAEDVSKIQGQEGDALISTCPEVALAVKSADCVPILIGHPEGWVAAVHSGWKGTEAQILFKVLMKAKNEYGLDVSRAQLAIGPAISGEAYEVGEEVAENFFGFGEDIVVKKPGSEKFLLDLQGANQILAQRAGVLWENILVHQVCTLKEFSDYYSHRASQAQGLKSTGRNYSWIRLS
jgi:YfiH family protein